METEEQTERRIDLEFMIPAIIGMLCVVGFGFAVAMQLLTQ